MNFDYVFILSYGRAGTTLLQGILNSIDGVQLRGENHAALRQIYRSWKKIADVEPIRAAESTRPTHPWYGIGNVDLNGYGFALAEAFITNVLRPDPGVAVTGFKEILYHPDACPDLDAEVDFMRRYFPNSAFIVNTREMEATLLSNKAARHGTPESEIRASDLRLRAFAAAGHPDVFHIHYDDYKRDPSRLRPLFEFLGAPFDKERIAKVMRTPHSGMTVERPLGA